MKIIISKTFERFRSAISNTALIFQRELHLLLSDLGVTILLLIVPVVYPFLYSLIYYPEVVRDLPVAVVDLSQTADSRAFIRKLNATPDLDIRYENISMEEAAEKFRKRENRGIILIPETYSSDLALGRQAVVSLYADMEFFLYYKAMVMGAGLVSIEEGNDIQVKRLLNAGLSERQAEVFSNPFAISGSAIANPAGGFASYGIPAALMLIIQQTLVLAIGIMAGTARERHKMGTLIPCDLRRMGTLRMVMGKSAAYFFIYAVMSFYMLGAIPAWFGYPDKAGFSQLVALMVPYLLSAIFFGLSLSVFFKNRETPMLLYLFLSLPLLFLSGIIWPLSNMSPVWQAVRSIFPSSHAMLGYIKMSSLGADISETSHEIAMLWKLTAFYFITACLVYKTQIAKVKKLVLNAGGEQNETIPAL
ncbi:MAG: ABC transporter permease [Lentimicrobium sp.]|nr:ABC transporter permease [Lentimicrobium sp.]